MSKARFSVLSYNNKSILKVSENRFNLSLVELSQIMQILMKMSYFMLISHFINQPISMIS